MRALITGASSGIGASVALGLAQRGYDLLLVGRRRSRLESIANQIREDVDTTVIVADISDYKAAGRAVSAALPGHVALDLAVLAAGHGRGFGQFRKADPALMISELETNLIGTIAMARTIMPNLDSAPNGSMILIGSVFSYSTAPQYSTYAASKAGLLHFARGLRAERSAGAGTKICVVSPGTVRTEFASQTANRTPEIYDASLWPYAPLEPADISRVILWVADSPAHVDVREIVVSPSGEML